MLVDLEELERETSATSSKLEFKGRACNGWEYGRVVSNVLVENVMDLWVSSLVVDKTQMVPGVPGERGTVVSISIDL